MEQRDLFNRVYEKKEITFQPSESLVELYLNYVKKYLEKGNDNKIKVLEVGSGMGSLFQDKSLIEKEEKELSITAIDFSFNAIREATKKWNRILKSESSIFKKLDIRFLMRNILDSLNLKESYDLVIDSHCFHCLNGAFEQKVALKNMISKLRRGGLLVIETMANHKGISVSPPYYFDRDNLKIMKEDRWGTMIHWRTISEPLEIEKELLEEGMKIEYFTILPKLRIIPEYKREMAMEEDPQCLRIICRKT